MENYIVINSIKHKLIHINNTGRSDCSICSLKETCYNNGNTPLCNIFGIKGDNHFEIEE